jgi:hypothetical protein
MLINFSSKDLNKLKSIINDSPCKTDNDSLRKTTILCIGDAIYHHIAIRDMFPSVRVLVLRDDYLLAGLPETAEVKLIAYEDWVSLSIENTPVITV